MVIGMETFREKFKEYSDCYTVIGGAACDILMTQADLGFRATKDIDDDVSSLSAILLNDEYYSFMMEGRKVIQDIGILDAEHIIPFKMCAWLDLKCRKEAGDHVNQRDLKKHKNDVFRLLQIVPAGTRISCKGLVKANVELFLQKMKEEEIDLNQMGIPFETMEALELLGQIYL